MSDAITLERVTKRYGTLTAVDGVDLCIPEGSLCGFLGPNGAGKSTTIRMIMSIIYPDEGTISVLGGSALDRKDGIGYLPEERGLYRKMRVGEFLKYIARLKGIRGSGLTQRVDQWLERMELPGVQHKRCQELSKGMQQKVQFIASVIHDPELIILDEPFSGLDPVNARLLGKTVREIHESGRTIIFSTHVLHQAEQICDRVIMINQGRLVLDGSMPEIRRQFDPRSIRIKAAGDLGALAKRLEAHPEIRSLEVQPGDGMIELRIEQEQGAPERRIPSSVLECFNEQDGISGVELRQPTLDDIFVELVGSSIEDLDGDS